MSTHALPANVNVERMRVLVFRHLREPSGVIYGNGTDQPPTALEFTPDLTTDEQARLDDLLALASCPLDWGPEDLAVFKAERTTLAAYLSLASPTNAQSVAALRALIRVVAAMVRQ